ncbi:hypothetical protein [Streptomyces sp. XH2]|uniref:hypothetical protein n=1 Tax=Streptomyces sp. XH2 TaxID=3412483 RepID=UPI003C7B684F
METRLTTLVSLDRSLGPDLLQVTAASDFALIRGLIAGSGHNSSTLKALRGFAACTAGMQGWIAVGSGRLDEAEAYLRTSLRLAASIPDPELNAYLTMQLAYQQCEAGAPAAALSLLSVPDLDTRDGQASARTISALHAIAARAYADLGDANSHGRAMDAAHCALADDQGTPGTILNAWVNRAELELGAGADMLRMGQPQQALQRFEAVPTGAIPLHDDLTFAVSYFAQLATAYVEIGELSAAAQFAHRAQDSLNLVHFTRGSREVARLRNTLMCYASVSEVRDFIDRSSSL